MQRYKQNDVYVTSGIATMKLLLRRSVHRSYRYSALADKCTKSKDDYCINNICFIQFLSR